MLDLQKIDVSLGGNQILSDVSLKIEAGELVAIIGSNGAGKSTLVKTISGELKPAAGKVFINSIPVQGTPASVLAIHRAVLSQNSNLTFPFTVFEVVRLGLLGGISGVGFSELDSLVTRALERVELMGFEGRYFQELSGGEKQRVHFARVLCQIWTPLLDGQPRFLILDEPTSSLDIRHQLAILEIARNYARQGGGVIAVLHDLNVAAMFADRIVALCDGRIHAEGPPLQVLTDVLVEKIFGLPVRVNMVPTAGQAFVLPQSVDTAVLTSNTDRTSASLGPLQGVDHGA